MTKSHGVVVKLVEPEYELAADTEAAEEGAGPPPPQRRRVYMSLVVTLTVLVATVTTIYLVVPKRDGALREAVLDAHSEAATFELQKPTRAELVAWSIGLLGKGVPWPSLDGNIVGARGLNVLHRRVAAVRYLIDEQPITLVATRAIESPPRTRRKKRDGIYCVSYRRGPWTLAAAGPESTASSWLYALGAPGGKAP